MMDGIIGYHLSIILCWFTTYTGKQFNHATFLVYPINSYLIGFAIYLYKKQKECLLYYLEVN